MATVDPLICSSALTAQEGREGACYDSALETRRLTFTSREVWTAYSILCEVLNKSLEQMGLWLMYVLTNLSNFTTGWTLLHVPG